MVAQRTVTYSAYSDLAKPCGDIARGFIAGWCLGVRIWQFEGMHLICEVSGEPQCQQLAGGFAQPAVPC